MLLTGYIILFFLFIASTGVLYIPILFLAHKNGKSLLRQSSFLFCFWSAFLLIFFTIILFNLPLRFSSEHSALNLVPLRWLSEGAIQKRVTQEIIPNILLFAPFGFFLPIVFRSMRKWYKFILPVFAFTFCIEFFQFFLGRSSDVDDLIANLLGGILGYFVFRLSGKLFGKFTWWNRLLGNG